MHIFPSIPVVCDPPCENGVCVENDTCKCTDAFSGPTCSTPGTCTFLYVFMSTLERVFCAFKANDLVT